MPLVPMAELLWPAYRESYAVPSFCVWSAETMELVLRAASRLKAPVILMSGPWEFALLGPRDLAGVARALSPRFDVRAALHLDHGDSLERVRECIEAGYTSVMLDFSARPLEENIAALRKVVEMAHPRGVTVEGELGKVGRADQISVEGTDESTLTDPTLAARFVRESGVDTLAVSIGNAHGNYPRLPHLDFDRLAKLREATNIPLVLHGGSGTPEDDLRRAIMLGMAKVNVATEIMTAIRESLLDDWRSGRNLWVPHAQAAAMKEAEKVLERWIHLTGAAGRAQS